ncbi:DUF2812 domain-containing protein [Proteiniclasticum sp. SCR006]|uniref:DUF2812 domain-containing protein n=1 Tax=Proteiniclasticum aestuarii TaxID=2817862 RepID=A0A939HA46_9CLOT|nr:DUF2812 domain-containing protein [Proteiniclasticum aestuarii]MBO1264266.1 DUF2812 domain-containing protein [Proteiniclasticum aestuarii]
MKKKYYFHPSSFSLSEIEEFYEEKARNGLFLEKRGDYLSRFFVDEPKELLYRVEVVDYKKEENRKISEFQVAVYEDAGWNYVCGKKYIHVFSADKEADVPELYYEPLEQIETIKILRKSDIKAIFTSLIFWLFIFFMNFASSHAKSVSEFIRMIRNNFYIMLTDTPVLFLVLYLILFIGIGELILGIYSSQYYISKLRKGTPLREIRPFGKKLKLWFKRIMAFSVSAVLLMGLLEVASIQKEKDPSAMDGPYMTLEDFGIEKADGSEKPYYMVDSYKRRKTIWGEVVKVVEYSNAAYSSTSFYQDVYEVRNAKLRKNLAEAFSENGYFSLNMDDPEKITVSGMDEVYVVNEREMVVVKDDFVIRMLYHLDEDITREEILSTLSEILNSRRVSLEK